ncbi:para-aminobenzoate synthase PabaA [Aspergillus sclerotioniger CBS 115572]|uniref:aminodeoxychorismate synthase n=1 Tax=Aspergillus sclerotioniger CBS 115572 TaxID=1450535 RepID=A0A317X3P0_9EURO|nr:para-aminobenzoate synthase PabaA [Aspergillus sclerotioniger CBS 115572]PWY91588.1 para-aminobenzoate synthase PabaA [Aspergillus sclerotioniger CBS 115572]
MAPLLGNDELLPPGPQAHGRAGPKNVLYVDAYDSFSYNVVAMLEEVLDVKVTVLKIDSTWPNGNLAAFLQCFEAVVLGPGPGDPRIPADVGIMEDIWNLDSTDMLPVFGICLGFQSLCLRHGAPIRRLPHPFHGQVRRVQTSQTDIFDRIQDLEITLYHSLYAQLESIHDDHGNIRLVGPAAQELSLLAWLSTEQHSSGDSIRLPMAVRHQSRPFWGVQFHPESCKSDREACSEILRKWWEMALRYNKANRRCISPMLTNSLTQAPSDMTSLPDIAHTLLNWSISSSNKSSFRHFHTKMPDATALCETLNSPGSPVVLFKSNGRHSIISVPSPTSWRLEYFAQNERLVTEKLGYPHAQTVAETRLSVNRFWDVLRYLMDMRKVDSGSGDVPFWAGFLGYFSYEMGLACLARPKNDAHNFSGGCSSGDGTSSEDPADASLLWTERSVILDHETGHVTIQSTLEADNLHNGWLDETLQLLQDSSSHAMPKADNLTSDAKLLDSVLSQSVVQFPDEASYNKQFAACTAEMHAGESYELCLTCETTITLPSPENESDGIRLPWILYKRLQKYNPAAFSAFAKLGNVKIVSSSPECFLNWDRQSTLEMKPMKGTVRKSDGMTLAKAREILGSSKEVAENLMIADLIRHDLYGICGSRSVHVEKLLEVEDSGRVYSMITHIKGEVHSAQPGFAARDMPQLRSADMSAYGLTALQRCLPPGSMTGAPKERSCMHLSSIESRKRGVYSGVMGFLDLGGGGSFSVLIRSAFCSSPDHGDRQTWRIGAGGAVTVLSTAQGEWEEMLTKLNTVYGIFKPLGISGSADSCHVNCQVKSSHIY